MSREVYGGGGGSSSGGPVVGGSGRSPRPVRRDLGTDPYYPEGPRSHSPVPIGRRSRSATRAVSPTMALDPHSTYMDTHTSVDPDRRSGSAPANHHRSRSQSRVNPARNYHAMDRDPHDREFMPIRDPRDRSMERGVLGGPGAPMDMHTGGTLSRRDRSLDRGPIMEDEMYRDHHGMSGGRTRISPSHGGFGGPGMSRDPYLMEMQMHNSDMQRELGNLKKELELTNQKLGSSMHSIKTFWSPELKKERALRKEESAKYSLINDQLKLFNSENQKQAILVRQLEEELRLAKMKGPSVEIQSHMDSLVTENEHLMRESNILRETIKELELRIETQKQTLSARDESIKKLLEMLQQKGKDEERVMMQQMQAVFQKQLDEARQEIQKREQDNLAMSAKMKTLEEQHHDYTRHIMVLKESLIAKEEHYTMLQADVEELRQRLEEKNKTIEKKTQQALQATQEKNRLNSETTELRDHMDIKDRKISVMQRKMDLQMANQQLDADGRAASMEIQEQIKFMEQKGRELDGRMKAMDGREHALLQLQSRLQAKEQQLENLEMQLSNVSSAEGMSAEANEQLTEMRKALGKQEEQLRLLQKEKASFEGALANSQSETERLLQVMQLGQEEQFGKDNTIRELQEALRAERAKRSDTFRPQLQQGGGGGGGGVSNQPPASGQIPAQVTDASPAPTDPEVPHPKPHSAAQSMLDGIAAPLSGTTAANLAGSAAAKATASAQAAKATLEQAKNVAQNRTRTPNLFGNQNSKPVSASGKHEFEWSEIKLVEIEGREREHRLHVEQLEVDIKLKDSLIANMSADAKAYSRRVDKLEDEILSLEDELKKSEKLEELEDLVEVVKEKNGRIEALEKALRQSVAYASELEMQTKDEDERRAEITHKLEQIEARLELTQKSQSSNCFSCDLLSEKLSKVEKNDLLHREEKKKHLEELFDLKHEALTAALSEKDAHIACLELGPSGGKSSQNNLHQIGFLMEQRSQLTEKINQQSEERIKLMQKFNVHIESPSRTKI